MASLDPLVRARSLTGYADLVRANGGDPDQLLCDIGLERRLLDDPDATLPLRQLGRLLAETGRKLGLPDFGMRLAQHQDISVVGGIAMIALHSTTFGDAMRGLARYFCYHTSGGIITLAEGASDPSDIEVRYALDIVDDEARRHVMELSLAVFMRFLRIYTPAAIPNTRVRFRHAMAVSEALYRKHFGCPVTFEQNFDAVVLPLKLVNEPLAQTANEELRAVAERYVSSVIRRFPLDIGNQVRELAGRQLASGPVSIERIAAQLNFHPRTLQRRLATQGLTFDRLIDELRRERTEELLDQHAIPLSQVGQLLGYGQQSTFIQACNRWFGMSPGALRQSRSHRESPGIP